MPDRKKTTEATGSGTAKRGNQPASKGPVRLVNRGAAGLLVKKAETQVSTDEQPLMGEELWKSSEKDRFRCQGDVIAIGKLVPDPLNARLHPERNMESIKNSLALYGQTKPLVVRKKGMVVIAGNGTLEAAKQLGWTKLTCSVDEWDATDALGYGLADNRSAEHAKWDFEIVARIDRTLAENKHPSVGWSRDELEVLRAADWVPPAVDDSASSASGGESGLKIIVTPAQKEVIDSAVALLEGDDYSENLVTICKEWMNGCKKK